MLFLPILLFLLGCNTNPASELTKHVTLFGRDQEKAIYQAKIPLHWVQVNSNGDLKDTKIPICSFQIENTLLTVHNFPASCLEQRISPEAQLHRWKEQIPNGVYHITSFTHGGFGGFRLEAENDEKAIIAYAMQLSPILFRALPDEETQKRADYTLKWIGSPIEMEKNRDEIARFAESFEWITPIPYETL